MADIELYTTDYCGYCVRAKSLLDGKRLAYREINVGRDAELRQEMMTRSKRRSVPQIFINDESIGGYDELYALERSGQLDELLKQD
jgi:glutaredoxin 3